QPARRADWLRDQLRHAERWKEHGRELRGPPPRDRPRNDLRHENGEPGENDGVNRQREPRGGGSDEQTAGQQHERHAGARGGDEAVRALQVHRRRFSAAQLPVGPVAQPDAADGAHGHPRGGQPAHEDEGDDERKRELHVSFSSLAAAGRRRSKYTRSIRRRRTRSTTIRKPAHSNASPERGTRPSRVYTRPPTVVASSVRKRVSGA